MKGRMTERISDYLYGYVTVRVDGYPARALTALLRSGIEYWDLKKEEDGITFCLPRSRRGQVQRILSGCGARMHILREVGAARTAWRYRRRAGIGVGALVFAAILWASTYFVWDISVSGNSRLSDWDIIDSFAPYGVKYGAFIPSIDLENVCHTYLIDSEDIAWASVNLSGTRADIVVKERTDRTDTWGDGTPSDIIAAESGQIVGFTAWSGEAKIHLGQVVEKGEVLISGTTETVRNGEVLGTHTDRSYGHVWAQVYREYTVSVPLESAEKVYTGEKITQKEYIFFTKALKSFGKGGNDEGFYDKIIDTERVTLFGVLKLPIFVQTTVMREYTEARCSYTEEQAAQIAQARMMRTLSEALAGCELQSRKSEGYLENGIYTLRTGVYCIADIAKEVEITNGAEDSPS